MTEAAPVSQPQQHLDQRALKACIRQMNRAMRDSRGGGIMERFEAVSKLLFVKIVDEREVAGTWGDASPKAEPEFCWRPDDVGRDVYERVRAIWWRAIKAYPQVFHSARAEFPRDVAAVARSAEILAPINLADTPADIKGGVYEELLRNTFEKNENQQYFTPRHIATFMIDLCAPRSTDAVCDPASGSAGLLVSALTYVRRQGGDVSSFVESLRGAEVDERMAWVARINMLMHGGNPRSIHHLTGAGSLAPLPRLGLSLPHSSFDLIVTNPPFGSDMADREALQAFETGRNRTSRRRGVLFVERCLHLLKPGGRLAIVLDDSVLNQAKNSDIRYLIRREAIVEAVISLPDVAFMPYSTAKSSILIIHRRYGAADMQGPVFMADVENVGNRPNGDPLYDDIYDEMGRRTLKSDLPIVADLYRRFLKGQTVHETFEGTTVFTANIDEYPDEVGQSRLDVFFHHPARSSAQQRLAHAHHALSPLKRLVAIDPSAVIPAEEYAGDSVRWIGLGDIEAITGHYEVRDIPGDRITSNAHLFRGGDILFSRLRPRLRKAIYIPHDDEGGVCSSELLVLRLHTDVVDRIMPEFLVYMLRSDLVYGQLIYQITGVGRPRVSAETVMRVIMPLPPLTVQRSLVTALQTADRRACALRSEARHRIEQATQEMEKAYLHVVGSLVSGGAISSEVGEGVARPDAARRARATAS